MEKITNVRSNRLGKNTIASLLHQMMIVICGFILPRFILRSYGSEVNGLVNSISEFLKVIALLELGIGAVVKSALYKPLAEKDDNKISEIIVSAEKFFKKIALILAAYIMLLVLFYPSLVSQSFDFVYTAILILAMGLSSFMQYYFGMANRLLLIADQRGYIQDNIQTVTLILNTVFSVVLIYAGASIQTVKLVTSLVYICRPFLFQLYVKKFYHINRRIKYTHEPIEQKWDGIAQHLASFTISGTDAVVLSVLGTLSDVSIYSVYSLITRGIAQLLSSVTSGISSLMGEVWAKKETDTLNRYFKWIEWGTHTIAVFVWGCAGVLIVPFVQVYTCGVEDANYVVPIFAFFITIASFMETLHVPYNMMVLVAGHYKQTKKYYIIVAAINVVISVLTVKQFGIVGVAIGTFVAMSYHTIWAVVYNSKNLVKGAFGSFLKQSLIDIVSLSLIAFFTRNISMGELSYVAWFVMAIKVAVVVVIIEVVINMIFYRDKLMQLANKLGF